MSEVTPQPKRRMRRPALLLIATMSVSLAASACSLTTKSASGGSRGVTLAAGGSTAATTVPTLATTPAAVPTPVTVPTPATTPATPVATTPATTPTTSPVPASPHFDTPQAAMTYLAAAWDAGNMSDVDHVSTPSGRAALTAMGSQADNLKLLRCVARQGVGDYLCFFLHGNDSTGPGSTLMFVVGPATTPGWYLTVIMPGRCD